MKKILGSVVMGIVLFGSINLLAASQMKLNDDACYTLSLASITYDSIHLYGRILSLGDDDTIYFKEDGKIVGLASKAIGHVIIEAPEEKCLNSKKPAFSSLRLK